MSLSKQQSSSSSGDDPGRGLREILKSEAQTFCFECGPVPFLGTNADCFNCCKTKYGSPPVVSGVVEGSEKHCHCYCCFFCFPIKHQGQNLSLLAPISHTLNLLVAKKYL
ncbi:PREDICTED: uncharacterized protein LOC106336608 [Brassica oleracea var. oleracea]|uniref:uncharacterized protein LOC106336608 n=1 Tax=Brassica oleracea var. oleracea TaxID=109376 RepID=UPI0006A6A4C0|nr:PREDICTED: uncharacterized protein LOC106336608 [Brassica oleracea var. oleracea]